MLKIGFLGPKGTFSQEALEKYVKGVNYKAYSYNTIPDMLFAVEQGDIDEAVVPIENSLEGAVNATLDILAAEVDLKIKAEIVIAINQNILIKKGTAKKHIKYILSHPQPIGQCRKYLSKNFPDAQIKFVYSTAGAAQEVLKYNNDSAAIGSITAAKEYGLDILSSNIQDGENNLTRFVVISRVYNERTEHDKTSIVFSTQDKPGSLYRVLDIFNLWDINMVRIESRPAKNKLGSYIFFIDIDGHMMDQDIEDAFTMIKRKTSFFKFLGSYPRYEA